MDDYIFDLFDRADSASMGSPTFGPSNPYTEVEAVGAVASISGGQAAFTGGSNYGARAYVLGQAPKSNLAVFATLSADQVWPNTHPFIAVRTPPNPTWYAASAWVALLGGWILQPLGGSMQLFFVSTGSGSPDYASPGLGPWAIGDEWGIVAIKDWLFVFKNRRLVHRVQSNFGIANTGWALGSGADTNSAHAGQSFSKFRVMSGKATFPLGVLPRLAFDRDGTTGRRYGGSYNIALTAQELQDLNENDVTDGPTLTIASSIYSYLALVFPEPRNLYGLYVEHAAQSAGFNFNAAQYSLDTTDGSNGGWTTIPGAITSNLAVAGATTYRTGVMPVNIDNVKGLRLLWQGNSDGQSVRIVDLHVYGEPVITANTHRVALWHPLFDVPLAGIDLGDVVRGDTVTKDFRIKNTSPTYTMNNVVLDLESLEYGTALTDEFSIKRASEGIFHPNTTVASLAPGALSEVVTVRRIVAAGAAYRLDSLRVRSQIGSLT